MRILIFHGYLLRGTGSNIYNLELARALGALGHEVHLLCQDRDPPDIPGATVHNPDIGNVLPVYVQDDYEGFEARPFSALTDAELDFYVEANVAAVREVVDSVAPDLALANHAVMGPAILARGLGGEVPYAAKIHGSALEYVVRPDPGRFGPWAREGLRGASGILVGSAHTAEALWEVLGEEFRAKTVLGPPGVDEEAFRPDARGLPALAGRLEGVTGAFGGDAGAAQVIAALDPAEQRIVSYVGKLIVSKGVDLLVAAWPLVARAVPDARLVVVGFGGYREACEELARAATAGDVAGMRAVAARGREPEGGPPGSLSFLEAFLDVVPEGYGGGQIDFTGRLEHSDLPPLLAASEAQVVPSTFPEAFGMVAAEAAACGALPVCARHSGLAEVSAALEPALPPERRHLLSFDRGPEAVWQIAARLVEWLRMPVAEREQDSGALAALARERYG
ncbi:MAG: glycosyltransferase family 4 protein, partial [Thermoleophilaceae bacterium]|nr:glycosyltransferase family 4 protein [Thermoleophilaceae bacterium]